MNVAKLIHMANQIATFFRAYPEDDAVNGINDHLVSFWTPAMRAAVISHKTAGGEGLDPLVDKALHTLIHAESPIKKTISGPETVGELGSDAG